jgi:hypothetical protein
VTASSIYDLSSLFFEQSRPVFHWPSLHYPYDAITRALVALADGRFPLRIPTPCPAEAQAWSLAHQTRARMPPPALLNRPAGSAR